MSEAREIELGPVAERVGGLDLVRINVAPMNNICAETMVPTMPFLFRSKEVGKLVGAVVERELSHAVEGQGVDWVLTTGRAQLQETVRREAQRVLDGYGAGVRLVSTNIKAAYPPAEVNDAFKAVAGARSDRDRIIDLAEGGGRGFAGGVVANGTFVHRNALARDGRLVDTGHADHDHAVGRQPVGLGEQAGLVTLYRELGTKLAGEFIGWHASVITSDMALGKAIGLRAQKKYALFNGALECELYCFDLAPREAVAPRAPRPLSAGAEMVRNRLAKNWQHLRKRAQREGVHALRVYDADLPEYAAAVDVYEARPAAGDMQRWLHVQEYQAPASIPEDVARQRWRELLRAAGEALDVPRERIATKQRYRAKGGEKYGRLDQRGEFLEVEEGGLRFLVNLWDYLDTGLFLDHRPLRARVRELARGKRFLNLFCYTGAVSVYAAAGGAAGTTSVDLSATYLDWASRNLALNGFAGAAHRLVRADAMAFAEQDRGEYDLIFVDPPTFSNSKSAADFDVQRDHVRLLRACAPRLAPGGLLLFSNNFRRFRLDTEALDGLSVRDISASSIPFDFARNPRIHQAWELRPGSAGRRGPVAPLPTGKD